MYLSIYLPTYPCLSISLSICLSVCLSCIYLPTYLFINQSINQSVYLSIYLSINQHIYLPTHLPIYPSIHPSIHECVFYLSTYLSMSAFSHTCLNNHRGPPCAQWAVKPLCACGKHDVTYVTAEVTLILQYWRLQSEGRYSDSLLPSGPFQYCLRAGRVAETTPIRSGVQH